MPEPHSPNFYFLESHDPLLLQLAAQAERFCFDDPDTTLYKLRLFSEKLALRVSGYTTCHWDFKEDFFSLLIRLEDYGILTPDVARIFHSLRKVGNTAVHIGHCSHQEALHHLKMARSLALWFHRSFGKDRGFKAQEFVLPAEKKDDGTLHEELASLSKRLSQLESEVRSTRHRQQQESQSRREAEANAERAWADLSAALELAEEMANQLEAERKGFQHLPGKRHQLEKSLDLETLIERTRNAAEVLFDELDEVDRRWMVEDQLQSAGWEANFQSRTFSNGYRPQKGLPQAIAQWPTYSGACDYVLFLGSMPIGIALVQSQRGKLSELIEQAARCSQDYAFLPEETVPPLSPWGQYRLPLLFAASGRAFNPRFPNQSGILFRDLREEHSTAKVLNEWPSPEEIFNMLGAF